MPTITKSDELRLHNRSRVLTCLRTQGKQSRTHIGEITGLSGATVTQVTADLIDEGVIEHEIPATVGNARRGRPQVILSLKPEVATTAVLTLLLNQIEVTLYDYAGKQLQRINKRVITTSLTASTLEKRLVETLDSALAADPHFQHTLKQITLVCQGTVSSDNRILQWSPITSVTEFNFRDSLQARYDVFVTVHNDCNMIARALHRQQQASFPLGDSTDQAAQKTDNLAAILLSYGIGLGFFYRGSILGGSQSSGTEFGHMLYQADGALCRCGRRGCIEAYASDYAIWRRANELPLDSTPQDLVPQEEFELLINTAKTTDGPARVAFTEAGAAIGQGLTNLFAIFDPFPTLLVGPSAVAFELMEPALVKNLRHYGTGDSSTYVSVYSDATENELIRNGASLQALSYVDKEIFSFGATHTRD